MNSSEAPTRQVPTDEFRSLADMSQPDWRQGCLAVCDEEQGTVRAKTLADHHKLVSDFALSPKAPEDILVQWETARNLWLYAWHVWRFFPVAERHAFSTLEYALRLKVVSTGKRRVLGLKDLLDRAIADGLLTDAGIERYQEMQKRRDECHQQQVQLAQELGWPKPDLLPVSSLQAYCHMLVKTLPKLRNNYAHGSSSVHWTIATVFGICRDLINQLFT